MTTLYLIRHAEAEGNLYRRCHGHYDSTITDRGYRQIAALLRRFRDVPVDAVYASDLTRARTTAMAITYPRGLSLRADERLREIGVGPRWEDRTWMWLERFDGERLARFNTDLASWHTEGGQDVDTVRDRMLAALGDIAAENPDKTVAVVSHGMALRTVLGTLQGLSLHEIDRTGHAENTAVAKLEADEDGIRVLWRDDASHLPEGLVTLRKQLWIRSRNGFEPGIWFAPDAPDRFRVMLGDEAAGAVAIRAAGSEAELTELFLDVAAQGRGMGIRLLGQAVSRARALGCDRLHASVRRRGEKGLHCMKSYGFTETGATPEAVSLSKYFGYDEGYRVKKLEEALEETTGGREQDRRQEGT